MPLDVARLGRVSLFNSLSVSNNRDYMAIQYRFHCSMQNEDYVTVQLSEQKEHVLLEGVFNGESIQFFLDVTTSIKFAKTVRTVISEMKSITDGER